MSQDYWEDFYAAREAVWSGKPNALLVEEAAGLAPGSALDLGCGEGADAIWLAGRGWRVTAADVSQTALERGAAHAAEAGLADGTIAWRRHDLATSFPAGTFDLVSACYLHSPVPLDRTRVLRSAAGAVAPGGTLLIVGHAGSPSWASADHRHAVGLPTPEEVLAGLALPDGGWTAERSERVALPATAPDGSPGSRDDNVLRLRRS